LAVGVCAAVLLAASAGASTRAGVSKWRAGDYAGAVAEWRAPVAAGDADAQFNLAQAFKLGRGVPVDLDQARDLYRKAAEQGHEPAQVNLGLILFQQDQREAAVPWLEKAAARGEPRAQYVLGIAHFNGDAVARDWVRAYALMTRAAQSNLPQATTALSQMDKTIPPADRERGIAMAAAMNSSAVTDPAAAAGGGKAQPPASAPPPQPATVAASQAPGGGWRVQLGAFSTRVAAETAWGRLRARSGFAGVSPVYVPAGAVVRLQAGPFADRATATRYCGVVEQAGAACFAVAIP
jgi:TPR repeat protein